MANFFRSFSQLFRRGAKHSNMMGTPETSGYQQGFETMEIDQRKQCYCKVMLLDGTDVNVIVNKNGLGSEVYDQVIYSLDIEEKDYFGLQFTDNYHVQHWLDPLKRINKQVPIGPPYTFRFRVKFYPHEPSVLREELTRYQLFLQLKQDIQCGKLECTRDIAVELAAYALQSELGDCNLAEHTPAFVSEFRFHPRQDEAMEIAILEKFMTLRGQSPATAELNYLNTAKWIENYGVDMHTVEGKDGNLYTLGLTPVGTLVFDGPQKIGLFLWEKIQKFGFKNKKITLIVEDDADQSGQVQLHTFIFNLTSHKACKHLWKCAIEHHTFFRLRHYNPTSQKTSQLFRLGSTFRYRGRTEFESINTDSNRLTRRQTSFERRPSQRYGPRQSLINRRIKFRDDIKQKISATNLSGMELTNELETNRIAGAGGSVYIPSGSSSPFEKYSQTVLFNTSNEQYCDEIVDVLPNNHSSNNLKVSSSYCHPQTNGHTANALYACTNDSFIDSSRSVTRVQSEPTTDRNFHATPPLKHVTTITITSGQPDTHSPNVSSKPNEGPSLITTNIHTLSTSTEPVASNGISKRCKDITAFDKLETIDLHSSYSPAKSISMSSNADFVNQQKSSELYAKIMGGKNCLPAAENQKDNSTTRIPILKSLTSRNDISDTVENSFGNESPEIMQQPPNVPMRNYIPHSTSASKIQSSEKSLSQSKIPKMLNGFRHSQANVHPHILNSSESGSTFLPVLRNELRPTQSRVVTEI